MLKIWKEKNAHPEKQSLPQKESETYVFGELYSRLYAGIQPTEEEQESENMGTKMDKEKNCSEDMNNEIPEFTQKEIHAAIDKLNKRKASSNNRIRAEDTKTCDATTKEMISQIFNEVLKEDDCTPETWRIIRKSDLQKRKCGERWKLPPDLYSASAVQTVLNNYNKLTQ